MGAESIRSFLVVRRDNIGDLVCTTPLLAGLRRHYPGARIAALVNSYNRDVLAGNPDVDEIFSYTKAKHREPDQTVFGVLAQRLGLYLGLRRIGFDVAILAGPGFQRHALRLARLAGVKRVLGFVERPGQGGIELAVPYGSGGSLHEVEDIWRLLNPLGVKGPPHPMKVCADPERVRRVREALAPRTNAGAKPAQRPLVALHVSARKPSQRWPWERFAALARVLRERNGAEFLLLWAPGSSANPRHPGDDEKVRALHARLQDLPVLLYPTQTLADLIAAIAACDVMVCSDGGAMHIAAALGKPIVCLFGDSPALRWHPWGVPHELLQPESRNVEDVGVEAVAAAFGRLKLP